MSVTSTNLIQGAANMYTGAFGATEPVDATTTPGVGWTDIGGTDSGVTVTVNQTYSILSVDQVVDKVGRRLTDRDIMVKTNLAEPTLENLSVVLNGGTITSGANLKSFEPGYATSAAQPTYSAVLLDGWAPNSKRRRIIVRKVLSTDTVEHSYKKDGQTFFPVTFSAHYVSSSIAPFKVMDDTTP